MDLQRRPITEDEVIDAQAMMGFHLWAPPISITITCLLIGLLSLYIDDSRADRLFVADLGLGFLCVIAIPAWYFCIHQYSRIKGEIATGIVQIVEGAPETCKIRLTGSCTVRICGTNVTVPSDRFNQLKDANTIRIAFLPESRVAVRIDVLPGIGLP